MRHRTLTQVFDDQDNVISESSHEAEFDCPTPELPPPDVDPPVVQGVYQDLVRGPAGAPVTVWVEGDKVVFDPQETGDLVLDGSVVGHYEVDESMTLREATPGEVLFPNNNEVVLLRQGTYDVPTKWESIFWLDDVINVAILPYPGDEVEIIGNAIDGYTMNGITIGDFKSHEGGFYCRMGRKGTRDNIRVIGGEVWHKNAYGHFLETKNIRNLTVLGFHLHDCVEEQHDIYHGIYLGGIGEQTNLEVGYGRIENIANLRSCGIMAFGKRVPESMEGLYIHDMEIHNCKRNGILVSHSDSAQGNPDTNDDPALGWIKDARVENNTISGDHRDGDIRIWAPGLDLDLHDNQCGSIQIDSVNTGRHSGNSVSLSGDEANKLVAV